MPLPINARIYTYNYCKKSGHSRKKVNSEPKWKLFGGGILVIKEQCGNLNMYLSMLCMIVLYTIYSILCCLIK